MTHSLHRQGPRDGLKDDYIIFAISAQGINSQGSAESFRAFARIVEKHEPVNMGDMRTGNIFALPMQDLVQGTQDNSIFHAVFTEAKTVARVLRELNEADLGMSIVVSGLFEEIGTCCRQSDLKEHTVEYSLGVWGQTDGLPDPAVQEISTMCGHGMVSFTLIQHCTEQVSRGKLDTKEAARIMARQCQCGIFNPVRGARILSEYADEIT